MGQNTVSPLACHDDVWLLLPWYANQTLSDEERKYVEEHVKVCVTCRGELPVQQNLMENVRNSATIELCEHIQFANLIQKIRTTSKPEESTDKRPVPRYRNAGMYAFAASLLLLLALPFTGMFQSGDYGYSTLAQPQGPPMTRDNDLRVIFSGSVGRVERQHLLSLVNGSITEEPDSNGVYLVRIAQAEEKPALSTEKALAFLHMHPQVIFAEPALPAGHGLEP